MAINAVLQSAESAMTVEQKVVTVYGSQYGASTIDLEKHLAYGWTVKHFCQMPQAGDNKPCVIFILQREKLQP